MPPLSSYPPSVRERWRKERDRILDLLEEEENRDQIRKKHIIEEERQEILRKRKEAAAKEKVKLKAAKGMQKILGKALLRSMAESREIDEDGSQKTLPDQKDKNTTKKTVAFADPTDEDTSRDAKESSRPKAVDEWGDVTPGRLRSAPGPSLLPSPHPVKTTVVERHPPGQTTHLPTTTMNGFDSDDESELGSADDPGNVSSDSGENENIVLEEDDLDFDLVQHQREIALQYHEKRNKISDIANAAMMDYSQSGDNGGRVVRSISL